MGWMLFTGLLCLVIGIGLGLLFGFVMSSDFARAAHTIKRLEDEVGELRAKYHDYCQHLVTGDMTTCGTCGLMWDTNDPDPPKCPKYMAKPKAVS